MRFAIIASSKDMAGMNIREALLAYPFVKTNMLYHNTPVFKHESDSIHLHLYTIEMDAVNFEMPDIEADYFIFATKHSSKSANKTLSVHAPGNFHGADLGGRKNELCIAPSNLMKKAFTILNQKGNNSGYDITMEVTHHGPFMTKPVMFIEIGSTEAQWKDEKAGKIIADTIMETVRDYKPGEYTAAMGFGGPHYCANFNKIQLNSELAIGHICPKYHSQYLDDTMVQKMVQKTYEKVEFALIDWKGLTGQDKSDIIQILEKLKIRWKKTKDVK